MLKYIVLATAILLPMTAQAQIKYVPNPNADLQREVSDLQWRIARELDRRALQEQKDKLEQELKNLR